ncbi:Uncharacterized protein SCF082_LOCUS34178 [Durusdinium trenchii]|uniref:Uncharacterized protein n=1 Tax=Durusdinium trenchii TaxID=1381693 RepID=A0ABP0NVX6_9DINO
MPGFHSTEPAMCDHFDCHDAWKAATLKGFKQGQLKSGLCGQAISTVILMNEPDFYDNDALCTDRGAWCRVKAVLSAMDGLLQAEEEAQVLPSHSVEIGIWLPQAAGDISGCEEPEN